MGRFLVFPTTPDDFNMSRSLADPKTLQRMKTFGGDRSPVYYDDKLRAAHHLHFPARFHHRLLQHHYGKYCMDMR